MNTVNEPMLKWGGSWTEKKLDAFEKYVKAYLIIMEKYHWKTLYFDAFAGSGEREIKRTEIYEQLSILEEEEYVYKGAAERIVSLKKLFNWYYFIEKDVNSQKKLKNKLTSINPQIEDRFVFRKEDCNVQLKMLAKASKEKGIASLIFLDPFGMQVEWTSIEALKGTRSDIWILIPTGVIVNRLLDRKGELKSIKKLESFFGLSEEEIRKEFYKTEKIPSLFGEPNEIIKKIVNPINKIASLYSSNLSKIWKNVTKKPLRLNNSKGSPIFHFVFASNNKNAVKIAQQIISKI